MKAKYKGRSVRVDKIVVDKPRIMNVPAILQVKIVYKEDGVWYEEYVSPNDIEF
jgi:hypothetical protein